MMDAHRRFLMMGAAAAAVIPVPAQAQSTVAGTYVAAGMNPDGSKYKGAVRITEQSGIFSVFWTVGSQTYSGVGQMEGRVLTVNWGQTAPVVYVVMPDGSLHGTWGDGAALEKLTRG